MSRPSIVLSHRGLLRSHSLVAVAYRTAVESQPCHVLSKLALSHTWFSRCHSLVDRHVNRALLIESLCTSIIVPRACVWLLCHSMSDLLKQGLRHKILALDSCSPCHMALKMPIVLVAYRTAVKAQPRHVLAELTYIAEIDELNMAEGVSPR